MVENTLSRRLLLKRGVQIPAAGTALLALQACGQGDSGGAMVCADPNKLTMAENSLRTSAHYVETSPNPQQICVGCAFFTAETEGAACGKCQIFNGPVNAKGHCDSFSAKSG